MDNEHVSPRQEEYIKNHRRHHHLVALCRFLAFFLFLVLWEVSTALHWIDAFIFSSPQPDPSDHDRHEQRLFHLPPHRDHPV